MAIGAGGGGGAALLLLVLVCCVVYRMRSKGEGGIEEGSMKYGGVNVEVSTTFNSLGRASRLDDAAPDGVLEDGERAAVVGLRPRPLQGRRSRYEMDYK